MILIQEFLIPPLQVFQMIDTKRWFLGRTII